LEAQIQQSQKYSSDLTREDLLKIRADLRTTTDSHVQQSASVTQRLTDLEAQLKREEQTRLDLASQLRRSEAQSAELSHFIRGLQT